MQNKEPPEPSSPSKRSGDSMAGNHPPQSAKTLSKNIKHFERGHSENWLSIIKEVKSSDRQEIAAAYEKVMPLVVEDWAHWLLSKPRAARLPLIEKIAKHHGDEVGEMVKRKLTELHFSKVRK